MKKIILLAVLSLAIFMPMFASAQGIKDAGGILDSVADSGKTGLQRDLAGSVATIIKAVLALVGTIFLILTIYAGILWMTAQGEEENVKKAKDIIKASVIGLIIIMSAYAITAFVTSRLVGAAGGTSSNAPSAASAICNIAKDATACENTTAAACVWSASKCVPFD